MQKKKRERKNVVQHKFFNISSNMGFLAFFYVAGKHVGGKSSMQGECILCICNIFHVDTLNCLVPGICGSINKPHLFGKNLCFSRQFLAADIWFCKMKAQFFSENLTFWRFFHCLSLLGKRCWWQH